MELETIEKVLPLYKDYEALNKWHQIICAGNIKITVTVPTEAQMPFRYFREEPHEIEAAIDMDAIATTAKFKILEAIYKKSQELQEEIKAI